MKKPEILNIPPRVDVIGVPISAVNLENALSFVADNMEALRGEYICASNVHTTVMAREDAVYHKVQSESVLSLPDGKPLSVVSRFRGFKEAQKVSGPDLMPEIFRISEEQGYTHYFYDSG